MLKVVAGWSSPAAGERWHTSCRACLCASPAPPASAGPGRSSCCSATAVLHSWRCLCSAAKAACELCPLSTSPSPCSACRTAASSCGR
jgi:hypothetical protein